ncbi:Uncharacterised protein [Streptococcus pneumoniae]|nr:Uncharacterised protein [Streptococcus pneumoniae]VQC63618.1 Uncharacterised protein [Streptococcus pneumoniae]VQJ77906.1 Uncharacterised protein [Streptococcus pneumoniae]
MVFRLGVNNWGLRKMIRLYGHQQLHNNSEILVYSDYGHVDLLLLETNKIPVY